MISQKSKRGHREFSLFLHNIRSTHNVGSIFRTADAVRVSKIYLSGYTPAPIDRFGRYRKDISKVSLGAEKNIEWQDISDPIIFLKKKRDEGYCIIGLEQDDKSIDYRKIKLKDKNLIILGEEVGGIDRRLLGLCDLIAEIPMLGNKESLNVSVATGVLLYRMVHP